MGIASNVSARLRQFYNSLRRRDARQLAAGGTGVSALGTGFDLLSAYGTDALSSYLQLDQGLLERYADYEEMDDYPLISSAIDIFADDTTQEDIQSGRSVWVTSKDRRVQVILDDLLHRTLRIEDERWEIARTLCKYGNDFEEVLITEEGVVGLNFLPAATVRRIEGPRGELFGFVQDFRGKIGYTVQEFDSLLQQRSQSPTPPVGPTGFTNYDPSQEIQFQVAFEDWELLHFRLRGKQRRSIYGHSVLEAARYIFRRLIMLEDAAMLFRLQRAPEKLAFYVNVGNKAPAEALAFIRQVRNEHRKKKYLNPSTGRMDYKMNPFSQDEDYWIPSVDGTDSTRIEAVTSPAWQHMEDINYFRDLLFAAIKIPKAYLGGEEGLVHNVLASQDVRFAHTILRVQREVKAGISKLCRLHLAALGVDPDRVDFEIHMTVPSSIFELAQLEARNARADLAGRMKEFVPLPWLLREVFGLTEQDIVQILQGRDEEIIRQTVVQARAQAEAAKFNPPPGPDGASPSPPGGPQGPNPFGASPGTMLNSRGFRPEELHEELRTSRRTMEGKLGELLRRDAETLSRLVEVRDLCRDLAAFQRFKQR